MSRPLSDPLTLGGTKALPAVPAVWFCADHTKSCEDKVKPDKHVRKENQFIVGRFGGVADCS